MMIIITITLCLDEMRDKHIHNIFTNMALATVMNTIAPYFKHYDNNGIGIKNKTMRMLEPAIEKYMPTLAIILRIGIWNLTLLAMTYIIASFNLKENNTSSSSSKHSLLIKSDLTLPYPSLLPIVISIKKV